MIFYFGYDSFEFSFWLSIFVHYASDDIYGQLCFFLSCCFILMYFLLSPRIISEDLSFCWVVPKYDSYPQLPNYYFFEGLLQYQRLLISLPRVITHCIRYFYSFFIDALYRGFLSFKLNFFDGFWNCSGYLSKSCLIFSIGIQLNPVL